MPLPTTTAYHSNHGVASWRGEGVEAGDELDAFLSGPVAARLDDEDGSDELREHLRGLGLTGMGSANLEEVLAAEVPEDRDWAVGEALAEAYLEEAHEVELPWNTERDKRNPRGSLPGADIVGFQRDGASHRLALGEVKCSSEVRSPPQVMSGRSGMAHQIERLASDRGIICQLLKWLLPRVKATDFELAYGAACTRLFSSGLRDLALFGILVRDTEPKETDLGARARDLGRILQAPSVCSLIGLYLPWPISELPARIREGGTP